MADIGDPEREVTIDPIFVPKRDPVETPAAPVKVPDEPLVPA